MIGRFDAEAHARLRKRKDKGVPPPGIYNPKLVNTHVATPGYFKAYRDQIRPHSAAPHKNKLTKEDFEFSPDKLHSKVQGYVGMQTKTGRKPIDYRHDIVDAEGK